MPEMTLITAPLPPPKQIRFVNNQGQPPSKRRRINAACLTCRKRKTRCAGEKPVCSTCTKNGHQCQGYNDLVERKKEDTRTNGMTKMTRGDHDYVAGVKREAEDDDHSDDNHEDDDDENHHQQWKSKSAPASKTAGFAVVDGDVSMRRDSAPTNGYSGTRPRGPSNDWSHDSTRSPSSTRTARQSNSNGHRSPTMHHSHPVRRRDRIPYFRYFGPTAIVPGFKQNLPKEPSYRDPQFMRSSSSVATTPTPSHHIQPRTVQETLKDIPTLDEMPVYSTDDSKPVPEIIKVLVKTFFVRLGCNYPFLKEERFMRQLEEKQVEPILVDAMCALAARFSELPTFTNEQDGNRVPKSEYGDVFAHRVKTATVDTFSCPSVAAVQAFLLMAYEAFGANQDSALWMYLGIAIRMAVDLGLGKKEGVKYQGSRDPWYTRRWLNKHSDAWNSPSDDKQEEEETITAEEQKEVEQARIDTFWAVFMLDRIISSGTGRPATLRDDDMDLEIPEPTLDEEGWPDPFPACIKIIHLYGRASDVLNNIRDANDLTEESMKKLRQMESDLTIIYSKQHERLVFNTHNFKHYVEAGQGTIFILLHFWFHAMIIILHEPALLTPFGKLTNIQLLSNSRELARSSAKTIADIVAFAELIDHQSYIGNPFTSQPIFIAGCAFLKESALSASSPPSREPSPGPHAKNTSSRTQGGRLGIPIDNRPRHSLLTSAAAANYARCSQALSRVEQYWAGVGYIINAMEQRSQGIEDCETFAPGELERVLTRTRQASVQRLMHFENPIPPSPGVPPIAFSLTGTTNSPNSNLTRLYTSTTATTNSPNGNQTRIFNSATTNTSNGNSTRMYTSNASLSNTSMPPVSSPLPPPPQPTTAATPPGNMIYDPIRQDTPTVMFHPPPYPQPNVSAVRYQGRSSSFNHLRDRRSTSTLSRGTSLKYETPGSDDMTIGSDSPTISESNFNAYGKSLSPALPPLAPPPHRHSYMSTTPSTHSSTPFDNALLSPSSGTMTDPGGGMHHQQNQNQNQNQNQHHSNHQQQQQQHHGGHGGGHNNSPSYQNQNQNQQNQNPYQQQQHHNSYGANSNHNNHNNPNNSNNNNDNDYYHQQPTSRPSPTPPGPGGLGVVDPFNQNNFSTNSLYSAFTPDFMFECDEINLQNLPVELGLDAVGDSNMMESLSSIDAYAWCGLFDEYLITGNIGDGGNGSSSRGNEDDGSHGGGGGGGRRGGGGDQNGGGRHGNGNGGQGGGGGGDGRGHHRQGQGHH
ncbi:fungal-specific transcription factor domain-containing protein [Sordaria brevicollis]|uniref:Fungal-specific transcription factor domain-containing protein n=1 Tax=Sordaria brevicollis TaxID=83679 RepID=A0AAE0U6U3_SORBR|nr:fungal-specific transcription factor domain-containing protein [Sordaria brevicollis]